MKKIFFIFCCLILLPVSIVVYHNNPKIIISKISSTPAYKSGIPVSSLEYRIYLLGVIPVGQAAITENIGEYNGRKVYHLSACAGNLKILSKFFNGSAVLDSYVDMAKGNPIIFRQKLKVPGKKDIDKEAVYDQAGGFMSIAGVRRQIFTDTQDPLSAVFNLRRMDFSKTKEIEMNINSNQKNYILKGLAVPKDITVNKTAYKAVFLKAEISRRDKNPYHKSKIDIVLADEKQNIPVLIKVVAGGILINARLTDIK